jgi:hypothetical protein
MRIHQTPSRPTQFFLKGDTKVYEAQEGSYFRRFASTDAVLSTSPLLLPVQDSPAHTTTTTTTRYTPGGCAQFTLGIRHYQLRCVGHPCKT